MILPLTRVRVTDLAFRQPSHLTRSSSASCRQAASLNGPSVTMWLGSVHLLPHFCTVFGLTARNEVCADCWTNQGCGLVSVTCSVYLSSALIPTLERSAAQSSFFGSQELYSWAPLIP